MSDIDFDELDRAVAAVLSSDDKKPAESAPATVSAATAPTSVPVPAPTPTPADPVVPVTIAATPVLETPEPVKPVTIQSPPVKPVARGQFLDMVGPTKPAARPAPVAPAVSTPVAARTNGAFVSDIIAPTPPKAEPAPVTQVVTAPTPAPAVETPAEEPADFFAASPDDSSPHKGPETPSPFIPDAKVEKRPLGAFSAGDAAPLPSGDELHKQLVNVESDDHIAAAGEPAANVPAASVTSAFGASTTAVATPTPVTDKKSDRRSDRKAAKAKDVTPKPRAEKAPKYGKGTFIWLSVAIVVMVIGFGVGASVYILFIK